MANTVLDIQQLQTEYKTEAGAVRAVKGISFTLAKGEIVAIVGESGCGKSATSLSIMGLLDDAGQVTGGRILLEGRDLLQMSNKELRNVRGNEISMIFQEPMTSLNPVFTVGKQIAESLRLHLQLDKKQAMARSVELLGQVGIPNPQSVAKYYPHQLSGGMRQRVMIAIALACQPKVLIADEPTTALDVTIQAQILDLILRLSRQNEMSVLFITHDLAVVAETADRVIVMYAGHIVEEATVYELFARPAHPYTEGLLRSLQAIEEAVDDLYTIPGTIPNPLKLPIGCPFHPRCRYADELCRGSLPKQQEIAPGHVVSCFYPLGKES